MSRDNALAFLGLRATVLACSKGTEGPTRPWPSWQEPMPKAARGTLWEPLIPCPPPCFSPHPPFSCIPAPLIGPGWQVHGVGPIGGYTRNTLLASSAVLRVLAPSQAPMGAHMTLAAP